MQGGCASQQVKGLKYETDLFIADASQFIVVQLAYQLPVQPILAAAWAVETANQVH